MLSPSIDEFSRALLLACTRTIFVNYKDVLVIHVHFILELLFLRYVLRLSSETTYRMKYYLTIVTEASLFTAKASFSIVVNA